MPGWELLIWLSLSHMARRRYTLASPMNSTKVQNPRRKMQVALLAEPKTPLESSVFIGERERANLVVQLARFFYIYISICRSTGTIFLFAVHVYTYVRDVSCRMFYL